MNCRPVGPPLSAPAPTRTDVEGRTHRTFAILQAVETGPFRGAVALAVERTRIRTSSNRLCPGAKCKEWRRGLIPNVILAADARETAIAARRNDCVTRAKWPNW